MLSAAPAVVIFADAAICAWFSLALFAGKGVMGLKWVLSLEAESQSPFVLTWLATYHGEGRIH